MKTALVTGAAGGIGLATCKLLSQSGYRIGMIDLDEAQVAAAAAQVPNAVPLVADVTDEAAVARAVAQFGDCPDLLVNNAGIVRKGSLLDQPLAEFRKVLEVNLVSALIVARAVVPAMIARGGGVIVNVSSIAAVTANVGGGAYGPSKAAITNLTKQMAVEWAKLGMRVNCVAPGMIDGGMATSGGDPAVLDARRAMVPTGTLGQVEEIASVIRFLASDDARYVTGQQLLADGGLGASVLNNFPMPKAN